ncbi:unnamed protein product [Notodromas monacha]|uniref:BHLH domain-containing protein n=1 Tax=Notodromas monacha TaxID=399045 RepID=A0A7R9BTW8_9CRUS|nr:unnamed protein product [Notodromas monacha]CAG0921651.1 unnamed protein product [Notodromas monacha]
MAEDSSTSRGACANPNAHPGNPKYGLRPRSIINRIETERRRTEPVKKPKESKSKHKPAPLSKYRRKNANARERHRMHEINVAFESLRKVIPAFTVDQGKPNNESQLTKITTLRLAMNYISSLSRMLEDGGDTSPSPGDASMDSSASSVTDSGSLQSPSPEPVMWSPGLMAMQASSTVTSTMVSTRESFLTPSPTPSPSDDRLSRSCGVRV